MLREVIGTTSLMALFSVVGCAAAPQGASDERDVTATENVHPAAQCLTCAPPVPAPHPTVTPPRPPPTPIQLPSPTSCGALLPGHALHAGSSLASCDGRFSLAAQTDGNLVLYASGIPLWATFSNNGIGGLLELTTSGQLLFVSKNSPFPVLWSVPATGASELDVQSDGNVVLYRGGSAVWSSGTSGPKSTCGVIGGCNDRDQFTGGAAWQACNTGPGSNLTSDSTTGYFVYPTGGSAAKVIDVGQTSCSGYVNASMGYGGVALEPGWKVWLEDQSGAVLTSRTSDWESSYVYKPQILTSGIFDAAGRTVRACGSLTVPGHATTPAQCTAFETIAPH